MKSSLENGLKWFLWASNMSKSTNKHFYFKECSYIFHFHFLFYYRTRGHVQFQRSTFVPSKFAAGSLSRSKFPGPRKPSHRPSRYVDADEIGADGGAGDGETSDWIPKVKRATGLSASKAERAGGRGSDIVTSGGRFESTGRGGGRGRGRGGRGGRGRGRGGVEDPSLVGPAAGGEAAKSGAATD